MNDKPIVGRVDAVVICPQPGEFYLSVQLEGWRFPRLIETLEYRFDGDDALGAWDVAARFAAWMKPDGHTPGSRVWARLTPDPHSYVPYKLAEFFSEALP